VIHPYVPPAELASSPAATQNDSIKKKQNPASRIARFGAYPGHRILIAVSVQKFQVIVIINQARIGI
jgi:hypothetical protein